MDPSIPLLKAAGDVISRREWSLQVQHGSGHSPDHLYNWQLMGSEDVICRKTKNPANHVRIMQKKIVQMLRIVVNLGRCLLCLLCVPVISVDISEGWLWIITWLELCCR